MFLEVKKLSFSYGNKKVIDNLSFTLNSGDILAIQGSSGAGNNPFQIDFRIRNAKNGFDSYRFRLCSIY